MDSFEVRVVLHPDPGAGTFRRDSFADWVGRLMRHPALNPAMSHQVARVDIAPDGLTATLELVSTSLQDHHLGQEMHLDTGQPHVPVTAVDASGAPLFEGWHGRMVHPGDVVIVNGSRFTVSTTGRPHRNAHGVVPPGKLDRLSVVLAATPLPAPGLVVDAGPPVPGVTVPQPPPAPPVH